MGGVHEDVGKFRAGLRVNLAHVLFIVDGTDDEHTKIHFGLETKDVPLVKEPAAHFFSFGSQAVVGSR